MKQTRYFLVTVEHVDLGWQKRSSLKLDEVHVSDPRIGDDDLVWQWGTVVDGQPVTLLFTSEAYSFRSRLIMVNDKSSPDWRDDPSYRWADDVRRKKMSAG